MQPELIAGLMIVAFAAVAWGREVIKYKKPKQAMSAEKPHKQIT